MLLNGIGQVVVAHNPVGDADDPSTSDVLSQAVAVAAGLDALGLVWKRVAVAGWRPWESAVAAPGTVVFNLVEAPPGAPHV
nr:hypothetical protein [Acidobacteriota bacterium]